MKEEFTIKRLLNLGLNKKNSKSAGFIITFLLISFLSSAQNSKYIVTFKDKQGTPFSIENPEAFLSQRSIDRRNRQEISITEQDLPINPEYVSQLRSVSSEISYYRSSKWFNAILISAPEAELSNISALEFVNSVELVEPYKNGSISFTSWEPKIQKSKKSNKTKEIQNATQNNMLGIDQLQQLGYTGDGILIAVTDGGFINTNNIFFFDHLYENNKVIMEYNFVKNSDDVYVDSSHGTEVFSQLGAYSEDEYAGGAYEADYMLFVTEDVRGDYEYRIEEYNWAFAAEKADSAGADIINVSLGYSDFFELESMNYSYEDMDGQTAVISIASEIASSKGMLVVASAGNEGTISWRYITAPADAESVIAVGGVNSSGVKNSTSSFGPSYDGRIKPDVVALGSSVKVINSSGRVSSSSGTSHSAPLVTGLAALLWQANPELTVHQLREMILMSGDNVDNPDNMVGYGIPNPDIVTSIEDEIEITQDLFNIYPNPTRKNKFFIRYKGEDSISTTVSILNQVGQEIHKEEHFLNPQQELSIDADFLPPSEYIIVITSNEFKEVKKLLIL